jgi:hypothetical protein
VDVQRPAASLLSGNDHLTYILGKQAQCRIIQPRKGPRVAAEQRPGLRYLRVRGPKRRAS